MRINVINQERELLGWFDQEKAERFPEATEWDGNNHISVPTGSQWRHQDLYRTAGGRWVLCHWSQWEGSEGHNVFLEPGEARDWLIANDHDLAVERYFGEVEDERGPGRPEVGPVVEVRLPVEMIEGLDQLAASNEKSRAEIIRNIIAEAL